MEPITRKLPDESDIEYIYRMCTHKNEYGMSWEELSIIVNEELHTNRSESYYRKNFKNGAFDLNYAEEKIDDCSEDDRASLTEILLNIRKEKVRVRDENTQMNALIRKQARYESLLDISKEIASNIAKEMAAHKYLYIESTTPTVKSSHNRSAILELSDWHYGISVNSYWNVYNPTIARDRVKKLLEETIRYCRFNGVEEIFVVNLADLICGRIHLTLRLQSRIDVITQIIEVSEILAEFLAELSNTGMRVHYAGCLDNHSRLEPNKGDALDLESLARITDWYLKERLGKAIEFHENTYSHDLVDFIVRGHKVAGIHGDKDKPNEVVKHISLMTRNSYELVLTAHLHHFSCDEQNETVVISNGSLMGTDDYAEKLRLSSKPSQNLIIVSDDNVCESIYRIVLD